LIGLCVGRSTRTLAERLEELREGQAEGAISRLAGLIRIRDELSRVDADGVRQVEELHDIDSSTPLAFGVTWIVT
jgi:hypothetical protein